MFFTKNLLIYSPPICEFFLQVPDLWISGVLKIRPQIEFFLQIGFCLQIGVCESEDGLYIKVYILKDIIYIFRLTLIEEEHQLY